MNVVLDTPVLPEPKECALSARTSARTSARSNTQMFAWSAFGLLAFVLMPWFAIGDGLASMHWPSQWMAQRERATGVWQVLLHQRSGLLVHAVALLGAAGCACMRPSRLQGQLLMVCGFGAAALLLVHAFQAGPGASGGEFVAAALREPGLGLGAFCVLAALLVLGAFGAARAGAFKGDMFVSAAAVCAGALLLLFVVYPVARMLGSAFFDAQGQVDMTVAGSRLFAARLWSVQCLASSAPCGVAWNTLVLALATAVGTTLLGTLLALVECRSTWRWRGALRMLAPLPLITPPFVIGLSLTLVFGRAGVVNQAAEWAFGIELGRWFYGGFGVWVAQMLSFTPVAFLIMRSVVQGVSPSMEEASQMLRASDSSTFWTITLPLIQPGLANAFLVGFVESIADFGNPIVVGGSHGVLSTEIFFAIVGAQLDHGRAAALAWVLMLFALGVFFAQRSLLGKQRFTTVSGKGDAGIASKLPRGVRWAAQGIALPWLVFTVLIYVFAITGGFVATWGRDYSFTMRHMVNAFGLNFADGALFAGAAWDSLFTTLKLAAIAAPVTALVGLLVAWLLERTQFRGQAAFEFSVLLAFAIPGTVLGVSYVVAFNVPPFELTGTSLIIVLCFLFRNLPVGVRAGTAALKQVDPALEEASLMLRASAGQTLMHIVMPLLKPALTAALIYAFVRAITTVSAVIFLVTAETELATTFIIGRVGQGDYGIALAYSTVLILLMAVITALIQALVGERKLGRRAPLAATH